MTGAHAIVVLPAGAYGALVDREQCKWLSRGLVSMQSPLSGVFATVLSEIGAPVPTSGLAALRFWGQTGERSGSWMAAADPVHLQTRLRDLRVRCLGSEQVSRAEIKAIFDTIQNELGADGQFSFVNISDCGYVSCEQSIEVAETPAAVADGHVPDQFTPSGASAKSYHQLLGEIQMLLHEHEINVQRQGRGLPEINSLWLWGGGKAPKINERSLPVLYSNDPLFNGYWQSCAGTIKTWQDNFEKCIENATQEFVAVTPYAETEKASEHLANYLQQLQSHLRAGELRRLTLLFRDGLSVKLHAADRFRFWRGVSPLLEEQSE